MGLWLMAATLSVFISLANGQGSVPEAPNQSSQAVGPGKAIGPEANGQSERAQQLLDQAKALFGKQQYGDAVPVLEQAIKSAPDAPILHHYLGYALWKTNRHKEAGQEFEKARRLDPGNLYTLYFIGRVFDDEGETAAAIHSYEVEFALGEPVYDTYQRLAEAYLRRGDTKKALELVQKALQRTPWDSALHYQLARIYQKTGRITEAKEEFETTNRLKQADQASIQKLLDMSLAIHDGKADQVFAIREALLGQTPRDPEIMSSLGLVLARNGMYDEAAEPLTLAAQAMPDSYEAQYNFGLTMMKLGRPDAAEPALKKAIELRPDAFEPNSALAVLYVSMRRSKEAIERLNVARKARPNDVGILALLGDQYLQTDDPLAAIPFLRDAIRLKPENPNPYHVLIQAYQKAKDFANALAVAQQGAERFPSDGRFQFEIGDQLSNLGRYHEAMPFAEKSVQLNPSLVEGYDLLGDLSFRRGEYDRALASFQKAKALDPTDLEAMRGIGQTLVRMKRYDEAIAALNDAIPVHPEEPEFYYDLSQAYVRMGNQEKAAEASAKFQQLHAIEVARQNAEDQHRALEQKASAAKP